MSDATQASDPKQDAKGTPPVKNEPMSEENARKGGSRKKARRQTRKARREKVDVSSNIPQTESNEATPPDRARIRARRSRRGWGVPMSFLFLVLLPLAAVTYYVWNFAEDQYASTTGFTVRQEEGGGASDLLGGLIQVGTGGTASDTDILYDFIQSQEMVTAVNERIDLIAHYTAPWPNDWAFAIWPTASLEDLIWFWQRVVRISYDATTGLIEVRVLAFDAQTARDIANAIVTVSQERINELNAQAREDAMRYAREDLEDSITRLKEAREAMTRFRTRTQIVDPEADIRNRMGVMANLQQQLAEALIEYDLLPDSTSASDPRAKKALQRINVIRERILIERQTFTDNSTETGAVGEDYPSLIAEFESLTVDREFAEETYRAALAAMEVARDNVARQSRYLATYIRPTLPVTAEYPKRYVLTGLVGLFLLLTWSILVLIFFSIRDRS